MEAKRRGATIIHVDPRFTRTSAVADLHVPIRAGSDIAFLGGIVNHIISHRRYFREYLAHYTNAAKIVSESFRDTEDLDGLFSGWDPATRHYDPASWRYEGAEVNPVAGHRETFTGEPYSERGTQAGSERFDPTLEHPRCVFQILKRHYARYTPEVVEQVCGVPRSLFAEVCRAWTENSGR